MSLMAACLGIISGEQILNQMLRRDLEEILRKESMEIGEIVVDKLDKRIVNSFIKIFSNWIGIEFERKTLLRIITKIIPILGEF
jgi:hypothetical protein